MTEILERLKTLTVGDVMSSDAIELAQTESLEGSATIMMDHQVSGLPVVDGDGRCVGMLTAFDFARAYAVERDSLRDARQTDAASADLQSVANQMTTMVRSVSKNATLLDAARMMCDEHIHRLPVLDGNDRLEGIITSLDVVAALANAEDEQRNSPKLSQTRRGKR